MTWKCEPPARGEARLSPTQLYDRSLVKHFKCSEKPVSLQDIEARFQQGSLPIVPRACASLTDAARYD